MKAIFIAAGEGSRMNNLTVNTPKPLIDVNGKSILQRQICLLQKFHIDEILIITGPFSNKYTFENVSYINDKNFKKHDQLGSLGTALNEIHGDVLIIFGDILFDKSVLYSVCKNNADIVLTVDMNWDKYLDRHDNPLENSDKVGMIDGQIKRIFKDKTEQDKKFDIGEFIGLMKLNDIGSKKFKQIFLDLQKNHSGKFHDANSFHDAKLVDFLQEMIEQKIKIMPEIIDGLWCEIDTVQDLEIAKKKFTE